MTIGPTFLTWNDLKKHSLLHALGCAAPDSGAPVLLAFLQAEIEKMSPEWAAEVSVLRQELTTLKAQTLPSTRALLDERRRKLDLFFKQIQSIPGPEREALTHLLSRHTILAARSDKPVQIDFIHGLIQLSKSRKPGADSQWRFLWPTVFEKSQLPGIRGGWPEQIRDFADDLHELLASTIPDTRGSITIRTLKSAVSAKKDSITSADLPDKVEGTPQPPHPVPIVQAARSEESLDTPWRWGDYISSKRRFSSTSQRLGLDTWGDLPVEQVLGICRQMHVDFQDATAANRTSIVLAVLSLITGVSIEKVTLLRFEDAPDAVSLDNSCSYIVAAKDLFQDRKLARARTKSDYFWIPIPSFCSAEIRRWCEIKDGNTLAEVLPALDAGRSLDQIIKDAEKYLKNAGDPHLVAWPGRWAASGPKLFLRTLDNDLLSAICSISPHLSAPGALNYFHPLQVEINQACTKVYKACGWILDLSSIRPLECLEYRYCADQHLPAFDRLINDFVRACRSVCEYNDANNESISAFNLSTDLATSLVVLLTGGRGSRTDQLKVGSLLCSEDLLHLDDKEVEEDRGSRIVPKSSPLQRVLNWYLTALQAFSQAALNGIHHNDRKTWKELSKLQLRSESALFQRVTKSTSSLAREAIEPAHIEAITQRYFGEGKNFGRHLLVTEWSRHCADTNLLRVITGHSQDRLDVPNALSALPPSSVIGAAAIALDEVTTHWFTPESLPDLPQKPEFELLNLSLGRVHKAAAHYTKALGELGSACHLGRWHLVSTRLVDALRVRLLKDASKLSPAAGMLLHLALFDFIYEESDLGQILAEPTSFVPSSYGHILRWRRPGERIDICLPLQVPTCRFLAEHYSNFTADSYAQACLGAEDWLINTVGELKEFSPGRKRQGANNQGKEDESAVQSDLLPKILSAIHLYADLYLPGIGQFAFNPHTHCALPESASAMEMLHARVLSPRIDFRPSGRIRDMDSRNSGPLDSVLKALSEAASQSRGLGGDKSRYTYYREKVGKAFIVPETAPWADLIDRCIRRGFDLLIGGRKSMVAISTMLDYLQELRPRLESLPNDPPSELSEFEFLEVARLLKEPVPKKNSSESTATAESQKHSEAHWLLHRLRDLGYPIPDQAFESSFPRVLKPTRSTGIVHLSSSSLPHLERCLDQATYDDSELFQSKTRMALALLWHHPLRWGEVKTLRSSDMSAASTYLLIHESDFQHIKSDYSWRYLLTEAQIADSFRTLAHRTRVLARQPHATHYVFADVGKPEDKLPTLNEASIIHQRLTESLRWFTRSPNARVHGLRARTANQIAFGDWEQMLEAWLLGQAALDDLTTYFGYSAHRMWSVELARSSLGHGSSTTSAYYYLYAAGIVRQLAAAATLCTLNGSNESRHTLLPVPRLANENPTEGLSIPGERTGNTVPSPSAHLLDKFGSQREFVGGAAPSSIEHMDLTRYFCLRLLDVSSQSAGDQCELTTSSAYLADSMYLATPADSVREDLRSRQGGTSDGRARAGDLDVLQSEFFATLYKAWMGAEPDELANIYGFLMGKGDIVDWEDRLELVLNRRFRNHGLWCQVVIKADKKATQTLAWLRSLPNVLEATTHTRQSRHPRVFVLPSDQAISQVMKSRYLSVARMVTWTLLTLQGRGWTAS